MNLNRISHFTHFFALVACLLVCGEIGAYTLTSQDWLFGSVESSFKLTGLTEGMGGGIFFSITPDTNCKAIQIGITDNIPTRVSSAGSNFAFPQLFLEWPTTANSSAPIEVHSTIDPTDARTRSMIAPAGNTIAALAATPGVTLHTENYALPTGTETKVWALYSARAKILQVGRGTTTGQDTVLTYCFPANRVSDAIMSGPAEKGLWACFKLASGTGSAELNNVTKGASTPCIDQKQWICSPTEWKLGTDGSASIVFTTQGTTAKGLRVGIGKTPDYKSSNENYLPTLMLEFGAENAPSHAPVEVHYTSDENNPSTRLMPFGNIDITKNLLNTAQIAAEKNIDDLRTKTSDLQTRWIEISCPANNEAANALTLKIGTGSRPGTDTIVTLTNFASKNKTTTLAQSLSGKQLYARFQGYGETGTTWLSSVIAGAGPETISTSPTDLTAAVLTAAGGTPTDTALGSLATQLNTTSSPTPEAIATLTSLATRAQSGPGSTALKAALKNAAAESTYAAIYLPTRRILTEQNDPT